MTDDTILAIIRHMNVSLQAIESKVELIAEQENASLENVQHVTALLCDMQDMIRVKKYLQAELLKPERKKARRAKAIRDFNKQLPKPSGVCHL